MRDIETGSSLDLPQDKLIQLYWDVILIMESQFLYDVSHLKKFQNHLIDTMGTRLRYNNSKTLRDTRSWRGLCDNYMMVYLPLIFDDLIWCKYDSVYLHVVLPPIESWRKNDGKQSTCKEWLLSLLELSNSLDLQYLRLYLRRNDSNTNDLTTLLRNLNWIGGRILPNENRNELFDTDNNDRNGFDNLMLGDENFVILEFES